MSEEYKYDAFISYRHVSPDKEIASQLQRMLESYNPPKALLGGKKRKKWHVFRDETELTTSSDLSNDIKNALENSNYLIVICSKTTKDSRWCMEEIEHFKKLHQGNNAKIITVIADGTPEEVFPPQLCNELIPVTDDCGNITYRNHVIEPLAASVAGKNLKESLKKLKAEFLRIAAPLLGCGYDNLVKREQKKKMRRIVTVGGVVIATLLLFGIYNSAMLWQINNQKMALSQANEELQKKSEELSISYLNLQKSNEELMAKTKEAQDNLAEANRQQLIAEENMNTAIKNENAANQANKSLRNKTAEVLANQAQMYLGDDNTVASVKTALEVLALNSSDKTAEAMAESAIISAAGVYSAEARMISKELKLSGYVKFMEFSADGESVMAADSNGMVYVINYQSGDIIAAYSPIETFGKASDFPIDDICVEGNNGFVLCNEQLICIDLDSGRIDWHYNKGYSGYSYANKITTNPMAEYVALSGGSYPVILSKATGEKYDVFNGEGDYTYGSWKDYPYLSKEGRLYTVNTADKSIAVYDMGKNTSEKYSLDIPDNCEILAVGENADSLFVNVLTKATYDKESGAKLFCLNKADLSVKWSREYKGNYLATSDVNKVFEFTHRIPDSTGEYHSVTGIVVVSGVNVIAFDKSTGEIYFKAAEELKDEILYCESNGSYSLMVGNATSFGQCLLYVGEGVENALISKDDALLHTNAYYFDQKRKYIAFDGNNRFALASENSSEISFYYRHTNPNNIIMREFPGEEYYSFNKCTDNKKGVFAGCYSKYEAEELIGYLVLYDVNKDKLIAHKRLSANVEKMCFIGDNILFMVDRSGYAMALDAAGDIIAEGSLKDKIAAATPKAEYNNIAVTAIYPNTSGTGILYCTANGIYEIRLSDGGFKASAVLYGGNLSKHCVSKDFVSVICDYYKDDSSKIACFKNGDDHISYVMENGKEAVFKRDSITDITINEKREIAFISKEGYIGIYNYGKKSLSKIYVPQGEVTPLKLLFTPDLNYLVAMCSNGEFVRYSVKTLQEAGRYKSNLVVNQYSEYEFVDNTAFIAKRSSSSSEVILVDTEVMDIKAEIKDFVYFMKEDKKILFTAQGDEQKLFGYFNYLSEKELVEFADRFLKEIGS